MIRTMMLILIAMFVLGCDSFTKTSIDLKDVPEAVMKTAKEKLPDVTFTTAWKRSNGNFEVRGTMKSGKIREVECKADGTFIEME